MAYNRLDLPGLVLHVPSMELAALFLFASQQPVFGGFLRVEHVCAVPIQLPEPNRKELEGLARKILVGVGARRGVYILAACMGRCIGAARREWYKPSICCSTPE